MRLFYATESRVFDARCAIVDAPRARGAKGRGVMGDYSLITNFSAVFIKLKQVFDD